MTDEQQQLTNDDLYNILFFIIDKFCEETGIEDLEEYIKDEYHESFSEKLINSLSKLGLI